MSTSPVLLTLGYGKRSIDDVIAIIHDYEIACLADVRSVPWSRYRPEFSRDALRIRLEENGIGYLFLGAQLGGRPDDPECYEDGKVVYVRCAQRPAFRRGIERLQREWQQGARMALLCSESRPENCHRSKLLGAVLQREGIEVTHLDEDGTSLSQADVLGRLTGGQMALFDDILPGGRSLRRYANPSNEL